ncbi:FAD binding domain-containing protein [Streptomyces sp. HUAS TT11]|uniref:FAD binding domain-containing protein n=1 Tax=Streptomyces sp. HUAS TT11 TaxID=3447508 RepID=UPI003F65F547
MKPGPFDYVAPATRQEALAALAVAPEGTRVLAGGQSLVLEMNQRAARPHRLVDINNIAGFDRLDVDRADEDGGWLRVGALVRHRAFEQPVEGGPLGRLLARTAHFIAHPPVRTRGTLLGSLAYAHPTGEWPTLAVTLGAELVLVSADGTRTLDAESFLIGPFTTALRPGELLEEARFPLLRPTTGVAFVELRRTAASFAHLSAATALSVEDGIVVDIRLGMAGIAPQPVRARDAEHRLVGRPPTERAIAEAAAAAAAGVAEPPADPHSGSVYRRHAARVLAERALVRACQDISDDVERP